VTASSQSGESFAGPLPESVSLSSRHRPTSAAQRVSPAPPHDLEAEEATLGAMMMSAVALAVVLERLREDDFYRPAHRNVFAAIRSLAGRGHPVDPVMVGAELASDGSLADIGGAPFLHSLVQAVPVPASAGHYARIVTERARLRRLIDAGIQIAQLGYEDGQDAAQAEDRPASSSATRPPPATARRSMRSTSMRSSSRRHWSTTGWFPACSNGRNASA
jgi:hypothetical protein